MGDEGLSQLVGHRTPRCVDVQAITGGGDPDSESVEVGQ
jgi:hypothetical protein